MRTRRPAPPTETAPTATTAQDLLDRAHDLTTRFLDSREPVTLAQWESFDQTLYRLLAELLARRAVGSGLVDHAALPLNDIVNTYPTPLAAVPDALELTPADVGRLTGCSSSTIRARIQRGQIPATRTPTGWLIPHRSLDLRSDVHPADPTDPHPLARLAVTLGALTEVLHEHQRHPDKPDLGTGPLLRLAHDVLRDTDHVARHALTLIEPDGISRVTAIARHVATGAARLAHAADNPIPYAALPPPPSKPAVLAPHASSDRRLVNLLPGLLDRALTDWTRASRAELTLSVPSVEVIRNITSQGVHLYATIDALLASGGGPLQHDVNAIRAQLRETAVIVQRAGTAWGPATTAVRPGPTYIDAAQHVHDTLEQAIASAKLLSAPGVAIHRERLLDSLTAATHDLAALTRQISPISSRLIDAGVLFGHARALDATTDRLHARLAGRLVPLDHFDMRDLKPAVTAAETAAATMARDLSMHLEVRRQLGPSTEAAIGPQL